MFHIHITENNTTEVRDFAEYNDALDAIKAESETIASSAVYRSVRLTDNLDVANNKECNDMMKCKTFHYITSKHPGLWFGS